MGRIRRVAMVLLAALVFLFLQIFDSGSVRLDIRTLDPSAGVLVAMTALLATVAAFGWRECWVAVRTFFGSAEDSAVSSNRAWQVFAWASAASVAAGVAITMVGHVHVLQVMGGDLREILAAWAVSLLPLVYGLGLAAILAVAAVSLRRVGHEVEVARGGEWLALAALIAVPFGTIVVGFDLATLTIRPGAALWLLDPASTLAIAVGTVFAAHGGWSTPRSRLSGAVGALVAGLLCAVTGSVLMLLVTGRGDPGAIGPNSALALLGVMWGVFVALALGSTGVAVARATTSEASTVRRVALGLVGGALVLGLAGVGSFGILLVCVGTST